MIRVGAAFLLSVAAVVAAASMPAEAARDSSAVIRPGRSIGKFALGMTEQQLRRAAGRPAYTLLGGRTPAGQPISEWQYGLAADYIVRLVGRPGRRRVTFVSTTLRRERTPQRIGTGTLERVLRRTYPTIRCGLLESRDPPGVPADKTPYVDNRRDCTLFSPRGTRTIFRSEVPDRRYPVTAETFLSRAVVSEVILSVGPCRQWRLAC